jgi:hypothetical protein
MQSGIPEQTSEPVLEKVRGVRRPTKSGLEERPLPIRHQVLAHRHGDGRSAQGRQRPPVSSGFNSTIKNSTNCYASSGRAASRSISLAVYRFWRGGGTVAGAVLAVLISKERLRGCARCSRGRDGHLRSARARDPRCGHDEKEEFDVAKKAAKIVWLPPVTVIEAAQALGIPGRTPAGKAQKLRRLARAGRIPPGSTRCTSLAASRRPSTGPSARTSTSRD